MFLLNAAKGFRFAAVWAILLMALAFLQAKDAYAGVVSGRISCAGSSVGISLDIHGEIDAATAESVRELFEQYHDRKKRVFAGDKCDDSAARQSLPDFSAYGDHFEISSPGGSVPAAMAIGRLFRREGVGLVISGICFSSCVFILAGAVDRQIAKSAIVGIHRPYLRTTPGIPVAPERVNQVYSRTLQDMRDYLVEMDVSPALADDILIVEPENNRILTRSELKAYRLMGVDRVELQRRTVRKEMADVQEANQLGLERLEYTRRKMLGESLCMHSANGLEANYFDYLDCKKRVLRTGVR